MTRRSPSAIAKIPPVGQRSYGVNRAHGYGFDLMIIPRAGMTVEYSLHR